MKKLSSHRFSDLLFDVFFPFHCPGCGVVVGSDVCFCDECEKELEYLEDLPWQTFFPASISGRGVSFDAASALFYYEGTARKAVRAFKFSNCTPFADYAAERMAIKLENDITDRIDIITSVPMNAVNRRRRGYDQAELFARALSEKLGISYDASLLGHKFRYFSQHSKTSKEQRTKAADNTYFIKDDAKLIDGKNILICDDIFTTGSTIDACGRLLKEMGAAKVFACTICLRK